MKFSHSVVLAFIATALAQTGSIEGDVAAIPACAKKCLDDAILAAGCASTSDFECQCGSAKPKITASAGPCVAKACPPADLSKVLALTTEICALAAAGGGGSESSASGGSDTAVPTATGGGSETSAPTETGTGGAGTETTAAPTGTETGGGGSETTAAPTGTETGGGSGTETGGSGTETGTPTGGAGGGETTGAPTSTPTSGAMATAAVWNYGIVAAGAGVVAAGFM